MKKSFVALLVIAMLATFFPSAAFGASATEVTVNVRNQTGGQVDLSITLPGGSPQFMTLEEGVTSFTITEGLYDFYASTPCGNQAGQWNLNVTKTLNLSCDSGSLVTTLARQSGGKSGCDVGLYFALGPDLIFLSWSIFGPMITGQIYSYFGIEVNSPQEAADVWNDAFQSNLYAGCYDGVANYISPGG